MKISIITVVRNNSETIRQAIESVLNQTYDNLEYVVIDGKSTDGTLEILKTYNDKIDVLLSEKDRGIYEAMNKGIDNATGDIIGFLNSDDLYYDKDVLANVIKKFKQNPLLEACYADLIYVNRFDTSQIIRYWKSNQFVSGTFSRGWSPPHPTFFVRSNIYKKLGGFNLKYDIASDVELMMRFLEVNKINVEYCHQLWVKMRLGGISNKRLGNIIKQNLEVLDALKNHNLSKSSLTFIFCKLLSRFKQYLKKPTNILS